MALRRAKWTHEFNTKMNLHKVLRKFFGMPKILPPLTKLLPEPEKLHRRSYDGLRCPHEWPDGFTIRAEFEHFLYRVSIWCQFRDSVTPALVKTLFVSANAMLTISGTHFVLFICYTLKFVPVLFCIWIAILSIIDVINC